MNFNPPTCKGWDVVRIKCGSNSFCISIHPPARGGTGEPFPGRHAHLISIHPPARGGTRGSHTGAARGKYFNPPTRKGWDNRLTAYPLWIAISIHPPARGGTEAGLDTAAPGWISIHPPARGGTAKVHKTNFAFYAKATKLRWFPARVQHFSAAICQLIAI